MGTSFEKSGYEIIRAALDRDQLSLLKTYVLKLCQMQSGFQYSREAPRNELNAYADPLMESLLLELKEVVAKKVGLDLTPSYSYLRVYLRNATLKRHKDRPACEITASVCIACKSNEPWPLYLEANETIAVSLMPGDMVIYKGQELPHWRDSFTGRAYVQVFLHYVETNGSNYVHRFDGRELLGEPPSWQHVEEYYLKQRILKQRIPSSMAEGNNCPICGSSAKRWARKDGFDIVKCSHCGHGFAFPRPSRIKTNRWYIDARLEEGLESRDFKRRQRAGKDEPEFIARRLAELGYEGGRLLDVGAGLGRFTQYFQQAGFAVTPLEVHPLLAERIEAKTGLKPIRQPFEAWTPDDSLFGSFDVITISQVLEHIVSPPEWFEQSRRLLKPGGILFVSIPNFESLLVKIMGAREGNICPPTHLNFFTMKSLKLAAQQHGFRLRLAETPSVLPRAPAVDAVKAYLKLPETPLSEVPGTIVWMILGLADRLSLGRFLHGYFTPGP